MRALLLGRLYFPGTMVGTPITEPSGGISLGGFAQPWVGPLVFS